MVKVSKYVAVQEHLLSRVRDLCVGEQLPAEPVLCAEYGVSRITLRHAVDGLIADGWLVREHGRGTFVSAPRYPATYRERFAGEVVGFHAQQSAEGNVVTTEVLSQERVRARESVATHLGIATADQVIAVVRLRYVNAAVHHVVSTYLPEGIFPGLDAVDLTDQSLFAVMKARYGRTPFQSHLVASLTTADPATASALRVPPFEKLLRLTSTVCDEDGRALVHGWSDFSPEHSELSFGQHA